MNDEVTSALSLSSQINKTDYLFSNLQNQLGAELAATAKVLDLKLKETVNNLVLSEELLQSLPDATQLVHLSTMLFL